MLIQLKPALPLGQLFAASSAPTSDVKVPMALYAHSPSRTSSLSAPRRPRENIIYLRQNSDLT